MSKLLGGILAALLCTCSFCSAQELTVAAASDLQFVLPEITARFQKTTGHSVKLIFGSSGNFFAQIQNGARKIATRMAKKTPDLTLAARHPASPLP